MMHRAMDERKRSVMRFVLVVLLGVCGCPKRFDPRAEPINAASPDRAATETYRQAKTLLESGTWAEAERRFAAFIEEHPGDPLVPSAKLWQARAALGLGEVDRAMSLVEPLANLAPEDPLGVRARFILGLCLARGPDPARARTLLQPFVTEIAAGEEAVELHAALAEAARRTGDVGAALDAYGSFYAHASPLERRYILERAGALVAALGDERQLASLHAASAADSLGRALLGPRLAALRQASDPAQARELLDGSRRARRRFGLEGDGDAEVSRRPARLAVGLVLPLSGRNRLLGERALRGALVGAEAFPSRNATFELGLRDTESSPQRAAALVDELAADGVMAIIGSPDRQEAAAAAARAEALGIPFLTLAPDDTPAGTLVYRLLRPSARRAEVLAAQALGRGARRLATLFPDNPYGRRMAEAFAAAARQRGAQVVAEVPYPDKTTTFIAPVRLVAQSRPDAIFIPAAAQQLELVAAQLYATGVTRGQGSGGRTTGALVLATADGAGGKLLGSVGRYLQGALLAPVFFPDESDADVGGYVARFREAFEEEPGPVDALAHDALRALYQRADTLRTTDADERRAVLTRILTQPGTQPGSQRGATGPLDFQDRGERAGAPLVFQVEGDGARLVPAAR